MDGSYTAVVDRFEGDLAVLVVERDGEAVEELVVQREALPDGAEQDAVLEVVLEDGFLADVTVDEEGTRVRRDAAQNRFDRLADRPPSNDE